MIVGKGSKQDSLLNNSVRRALREGALWVFGMLAIIFLVSLISYSTADPGFRAASGESVDNAIGPAGAWLADFFLLLFGRPAFLFPVMLAYAGFLLYQARDDAALLDQSTLWFRGLGFLVTLATSCGLASLHFSSAGLPHTGGGILGDAIGQSLSGLLSFLGATLLLLAVWLAGVSLFLGISWIAVMDRVGRLTLWGIEWLSLRLKLLGEYIAGMRAKQSRKEHVREQQRKAKNKTPPRIEPLSARPVISERVYRERQVPLFDPPPTTDLPPLALLEDPPEHTGSYSNEALEAMSRLVELKLKDFGVEVDVVSVHPGPVVTLFELKPAVGVKVSQISSLAKDIARSLSAIAVRVVEVIPGKSVIGLEIPNETRELVTLGEILKSEAYDQMKSPVTLALGKDIAGNPVVADLARMPHLLIAGTTGSGKSVAINAMVLSILYKSKAEHVRLIMIDPKMLELSVYEGIPHLLSPVVTDMNEAANALRWCVAEMERRYRLMAAVGVRNLGGFNRKVIDAIKKRNPIPDPLFEADPFSEEEQTPPVLEPLPYIVVVIDELADLMMVVGKKVEELITRLAQKARASGIHMIVATQRPSVDVITGLIKANIPARIAFQVSAKVDSRTILDQGGAEALLGHGDMLFLPPGTSIPTRVHGAFVADQEVHRVVKHMRSSEKPNYIDEILVGPKGQIPGLKLANIGVDSDAEMDPLYDEAVRIVSETRKASISGIQRRLKIGYNRAARMVEAMEEAGLVGALQSNGMREVLVPEPPKD